MTEKGIQLALFGSVCLSTYRSQNSNCTVIEPRDPQLEAEILCQKITPISECIKNIENERHIIAFKSLTVCEKKNKEVEFDF
jgi:hypothetical protein